MPRFLFLIIDAHNGVTSALYYASTPSQVLEAFHTATAEQWKRFEDPLAEYQRDVHQADVDGDPLPQRPGWTAVEPNQVNVFAVLLDGEEPGEASCCISMVEVHALYAEAATAPGKVD